MDIAVGPFQTEHNTATTSTPEFRAALQDWVEQEVLPCLSGEPTHISGNVSSKYDDAKYQGPNSAVKYRYSLELECRVGEEVDEAMATLVYDPEGHSFTEHPNEGLRVITAEAREQEEALFAECDAFSAGFASAPDNQVCPSCGSQLEEMKAPGPNRRGVQCTSCGFSFSELVEDSGPPTPSKQNEPKKPWWKLW